MRCSPSFPACSAAPEVLERARGLIASDRCRAILDYISGVYAALKQIHPDDDVIIDLGLVHRNDYYTGILVRGYIENMGEAVLSGGRYDTLLANFGAPHCGHRLRRERGFADKACAGRRAPGRACARMCSWPREKRRPRPALRHAEQLASAGLVVESAVLPDRAAAQRYAEERGIGRVEFIGADSPAGKG